MRILYVDDIRFPKVWQNKLDEVTVARTYEQALKNLTVHKFDVVDLDGSVQKDLLDSIKEEGVILYEKI